MIIPKPVTHLAEDGAFLFDEAVTVYLAVKADPDHAHFIADELVQRIRVATGKYVSIKTGRPDDSVTGAVLLTDQDPPRDLGEEGYELTIRPDRVTLRAVTAAGLFYACQSFFQVLRYHTAEASRAVADQGAGSGSSHGADIASGNAPLHRIPCATVKDRPRFGWRGFMLDSARHFQPVELVIQLIDRIAAMKLNRLHWHLCDDQGWRLEVLGYPRLTSVGAWRSNGEAGEEGKGRYGGYYTQEQVREVVAYARQRHVTVVPEIEMPAHNLAALAAYPQFGCSGQPIEVSDQWGLLDGVYCAGKETTFTFLCNVLSEVAELFPDHYLHIGGDERKPGVWDNCPACRRVREAHGLADESALQKWFMDRIAEHIHLRLGRRSISWGDNIDAGASGGQIVHGWKPNQSAKAARLKMDTINSTHEWVYLDYPATKKDLAETKPDWMRVLPLEKTYQFDPIPQDLEPDLHRHILGSEAHLWTEHVPTEADLYHQLSPRLIAFSEVVWSPIELRDFDDFKQRLAVQQAHLLPG